MCPNLKANYKVSETFVVWFALIKCVDETS